MAKWGVKIYYDDDEFMYLMKKDELHKFNTYEKAQEYADVWIKAEVVKLNTP